MQTKINVPAKAFRVLAVLAAFVMTPLMTVYAATTQPTITVLQVNPNEQVQVMIYNLPADTDFTVTESAAGNQGIGPVIAHFNSVDGGTRSYWFEILTDVHTATSAEIRIDSGTGIYAYATFDPSTALANSTSSTTTTTTSTTAVSPTMGMIQVLHVQMGGIVVAEMKNMPLDTQFSVMIGKAGTQGYGGFRVGDLTTGELSDHVGTFEIPVDLSGETSLDLRIEAPGYLYLVTFSNTTY
jgi:hypothetical protein